MSKLKNKRILIFQQRGWSISIGHFLAKKLQAEGVKLAALTFKKTAHEFLLNQKEVKYDLIINDDEVMGEPKAYLRKDSAYVDKNYSLKEICDDLGVDSIWPIISTLRLHVKSYKDKYYYSFKQNVSDEEIIDYVKSVYRYIKIFFSKFNPDIIIAPNFVTLTHIMFNLCAERRGIKMIGITDCKIKDFCIFNYDFNESEGPFYKQVDALNNNKIKTENRDKAKKYIKEFRQTFKKPVYTDNYEMYNKRTLKQKVRHMLSPYYHIWRWYIKKPINYMKNIGISTDYRPPRIILRDHYCHDRYKKFMDKFNYYPFNKVKKFAYFPLQFQPEATTDVIAPFFSNQIEMIRLTAMSLPDDYTLVVKEHPKMIGLRSPNYIEKVARTPNVKLINYRIPSEQILKKSSMVISHNSTTLAEAAFYNKPAIQFGNLGTTLKLPNIFKHTDMSTLSSKIKEVLDIDLKTDEYKRRLENYVAAVYDAGFKLNYGKIWEGDENADMEYVWQIYRDEIERVLFSKKLIN